MKFFGLWGGSGKEEVVEAGSEEVVDVREGAGGGGARQAVRDVLLPGGGGAGASAATGSAVGFGGVGGEEDWEVVEGWEAGASSAGEAVRGQVLPGGVGLGAATGGGGDEVMRRGVGEKEVYRFEEMEGVESEVTVFPGGGSDGLHTSGSGDDMTGRGGGEEEEEEWVDVEFSPGRGGVGAEMGLGGGDGCGEVEIRGRAERTGHGGSEGHGGGGWLDFTKQKVIAGGARLLLYPTLACNVARNKIQADFHWWDRVDEHVVLGAVPFRTDVPQLVELGVRAVVTLTEPFETLVPSFVYQAHGIDHLAIPTPDYSAAPSIEDICRALSFMHRHALRGNSTYVHCKAGRGRSTTVVLCYLIRFKNMTREIAWNHIWSIRPRVALTTAQEQVVIQFENLNHIGGLP